MTNDSGLFRSAEELEADGAYPVAGGAWERGNTRFLPLMAGRSVHLFDHRYASVLEDGAEEAEVEDDPDDGGAAPARARLATRSSKVHNPYTSSQTSPLEHADPIFTPRPRFWVADADLEDRWPAELEWAVAFRDIARPTDVRTVISCIVPRAAFGNKLPLLLPALPNPPLPSAQNLQSLATWNAVRQATLIQYKNTVVLLAGNLGALVLDYVARNKVQSTSLNLFIVEQLPLVPPDAFMRRFGPLTAEEIVRREVLALTYTAEDLAPFARDQGFNGQPFAWDEDDRAHRRARLDAVFMLLYGLDRDTASYVLDTFPIVRRLDEERHGGRYRTRDLVLRYMAALAAGNPEARVAG